MHDDNYTIIMQDFIIIIIIQDNYMKSTNCVFEAVFRSAFV